MRANRKHILADKKAEIGIGTMIVFIASVLVAAVAAAVLIETSGKLQEKGTRTGDQTTRQVSSNMRVDRIVGVRSATTDTMINHIDVYVSLTPGSSKVDLEQLTMQFLLAGKAMDIAWDDGNGTPANANSGNSTTPMDEAQLDPFEVSWGYSVIPVRDDDHSVGLEQGTAPDPGPAALPSPSALTAGDIAILRVYVDPVGGAGKPLGHPLDINARTAVGLTIVPEIGNPARGDFIAPESFGADLVLSMR